MTSATENTGQVKLDFYALGRLDNKVTEVNRFKTNQAVSDSANNILERNSLSLNSNNLENVRNNYRSLHTLKESKPDANNYLNPVYNYNSREKYGIKDEMTNVGTYHLARSKYYSQDRLNNHTNVSTGAMVNKNEFLSKKNFDASSYPNLYNSSRNVNEEKVEKLNTNHLYFDKNNNQMIRYPKGFWDYSSEKMNRTKISEAAPEWFHVINQKKQKEWDAAVVKNEESLSVFSRFQKWITVTPTNKNRRKPLEKAKITKMEETSKIMPNWMQIKVKQQDIQQDKFMSSEYNSIRHGKKTMILVDKNINKKKENDIVDGKSIFSLGDYRHNLLYKNDADFYSSKVSLQPKQLLNWDDGKVFDPKYKKDVSPKSTSALNNFKR